MATAPQPELEAPAADDLDPNVNDTGAEDAGELTEVETLGVEMGWKPKAEYLAKGGDETKWKPAAEFIRAERDISNNLKDTVRGLKDTVERMAASENRRTERALREQAAEIEARWEQAVDDGDRDAARKAENDLRALAKETGDNNPEARFAADNAWYGKDDDATAYAVSISQREAQKGASVEQQLKAAADGVRKRFPELFGDDKPAVLTTKQQPSVHAPSTRATQPRKGTGFADLPAEAKAAAEKHAKLVHDKFGKDVDKAKADYAADYFANIAA